MCLTYFFTYTFYLRFNEYKQKGSDIMGAKFHDVSSLLNEEPQKGTYMLHVVPLDPKSHTQILDVLYICLHLPQRTAISMYIHIPVPWILWHHRHCRPRQLTCFKPIMWCWCRWHRETKPWGRCISWISAAAMMELNI